jgi:hypothetical protein
MARQTRIEKEEDGSVTLRVKLGADTWRLISVFAQQLGVDDHVATKLFTGQINALIAAGSISWLSADWQAVARQLGHNPRPAPGIDLTKLHRSNRTKAGFVGVYANGAGFRAAGRRGEYICTAPTAEEAAWRRYLYYKEHNLPYGEMEETIDQLRKQGERGTDAELQEIALETARLSGTEHTLDGSHAPSMLGFEQTSLEEAASKLKARDDAEERAERAKLKR